MSIEYRRLGENGVQVSNLCLGTMNFGWHTSVEDSFAIMDRALELGINFFDTADVYGWEKYHGYTEEILGRWFAQGSGRRDKVILATKVYNPANRDKEDREPNHSGRNLSALKIHRHLEASLRRLQTEVVDLYLVHHVDRDCPWSEAWEAFDSLKTRGKVIYVGSSNFAGWHIATANQEAMRRGMHPLVSEQSVYNLNNRMIELEVIPACTGYGMGLIPYSPVDGGMLAGAVEKERNWRRGGEWVTNRLERDRAKIGAYEDLCRRIGHPPAQVAIAWLLHQPAVTSPIVGPRTLAQLEDAVAATNIRLDAETLAALDRIFPGPGGAAPEAYAW
jgi:aryl-alcohol dehydrogenase-like predicted oxidoreductase